MPTTALYLKPNVQIEPLFDNWYAWAYLIPPATAARNVTERHLKIMDSYLSAPQVHAAAVKNPKMSGGPFIDYGGQRVDEIRMLRDRTMHDLKDLLTLSSAITDLDDLLRSMATGCSLTELYPKVPDCLRGYVELVYDLNNHPSFRIIEPLLYRSAYYKTSAQSVVLSQTRGDERPFVLSTPRLPDESSIHLSIPLADTSLDYTFRLKTDPQVWTTILDHSDIPSASQDLFRSFFTDQKSSCAETYKGRGARWRYFGHACILVEAAGSSILFDPVISYSYDSSLHRYTYEDLPHEIDYAVITHNHQDHILFETLLQLRHKVKAIIVPKSGWGSLQDPSLRLLLQNTGFLNVQELGPFEEISTEQGSIIALPFLGEHGDLDVRSKSAYLIRMGRHTLFVGADSCNIEPRLYEHIYREIGNIDAIFLGMECDGAPVSWLYGPLMTRRIERQMDESRRLAGSNYEQAVDIVNRFSPKEVYVYAMGQEPWLNHIMSLKYTEASRPITESNRLISECARRNILAERLFGEKEILLD